MENTNDGNPLDMIDFPVSGFSLPAIEWFSFLDTTRLLIPPDEVAELYLKDPQVPEPMKIAITLGLKANLELLRFAAKSIVALKESNSIKHAHVAIMVLPYESTPEIGLVMVKAGLMYLMSKGVIAKVEHIKRPNEEKDNLN